MSETNETDLFTSFCTEKTCGTSTSSPDETKTCDVSVTSSPQYTCTDGVCTLNTNSDTAQNSNCKDYKCDGEACERSECLNAEAYEKCSECPQAECSECPERPKKRRMRPPGSGSRPPFDRLFSNLLNNVIGDVSNGKGSSNPMSQWEHMLKNNPNLSRKDDDDETDSEDSEHTDTENENASENEERDKGDECEHPECHGHDDRRWEVLNRLLESHLNLTRSVVELTRRD